MKATLTEYSINNNIINLISEISNLLGKASVISQMNKNPTLRRKNRIRTIYSSLSIEQNTLSIEQVTAVIDGKHVLAPIKDIEEVKNAYEIYSLLDTLNPFNVEDLLKAHKVMMKGLTYDYGEFRQKPVGVVDSNTGEIIHFGTLPQYVPDLINKLLLWVKESEVHPLIKGCLFHYEFEVIHPFSDGNGRIGRLWHTLIMSKWNSIFAYLPIESIIQQKQQEYYKSINNCNYTNDATEFIEFMLNSIYTALAQAIDTSCSIDTKSEQDEEQDKEQLVKNLLKFCKSPKSRLEMQEYLGITSRKVFSSKYLKPLLESKKIQMTIPDKPNSKYQKYVTVE